MLYHNKKLQNTEKIMYNYLNTNTHLNVESTVCTILLYFSAGCGRTGVICAIDYIWRLLKDEVRLLSCVFVDINKMLLNKLGGHNLDDCV